MEFPCNSFLSPNSYMPHFCMHLKEHGLWSWTDFDSHASLLF